MRHHRTACASACLLPRLFRIDAEHPPFLPAHLPITSTASASFFPSIRSIGVPAAPKSSGQLSVVSGRFRKVPLVAGS